MKKSILILSAFILLAQGAAGADHPARDPGREAGRGPESGWLMVHREGPYSAAWIATAGLPLTTEQTRRIRILAEKYAQQFEAIQARLLEMGKELKTEWLKMRPDRRRIETLQGEVSRLQKQFLEKMSEHHAMALEVLTVEQRVRLEAAEQRYNARHDRIQFRQTRERR